ncbi:hypothetical protein ACFXI6_53180 [Streptomyces mirabilis]|uniref:hypothetical protein n=1 Tax=Streptomyces mirabilis TaxID=68239 RepID=UPI0036D0B444
MPHAETSVCHGPGRAALLAERDGTTFGTWRGELVTAWEAWRQATPTFIALHICGASDAAMFYSEILDSASGDAIGTRTA